MRTLVTLSLLLSFAPLSASADMCDFRLSQLAPRGGSPAMEAARAATPTPEADGNMIYVMINPRTGETSLGATGRGEAAEDDGFLIRTARVLGAAVAMVTADNPLVGAGSAVLGAGLEAACHFRDERITDYPEVLAVLEAVDASMPPDVFALIEPGIEEQDAFIRLSRNDGYAPAEYPVRDLRIVNGELLLRRWGRDDLVGDIAVFTARHRN